jgi:hypothetical protein
MSAMHQAGPPRAAEWLLQRLLDDRSRDAVLGDLHEGYASIHAHGAAVVLEAGGTFGDRLSRHWSTAAGIAPL